MSSLRNGSQIFEKHQSKPFSAIRVSKVSASSFHSSRVPSTQSPPKVTTTSSACAAQTVSTRKSVHVNKAMRRIRMPSLLYLLVLYKMNFWRGGFVGDSVFTMITKPECGRFRSVSAMKRPLERHAAQHLKKREFPWKKPLQISIDRRILCACTAMIWQRRLPVWPERLSGI